MCEKDFNPIHHLVISEQTTNNRISSYFRRRSPPRSHQFGVPHIYPLLLPCEIWHLRVISMKRPRPGCNDSFDKSRLHTQLRPRPLQHHLRRPSCSTRPSCVASYGYAALWLPPNHFPARVSSSLPKIAGLRANTRSCWETWKVSKRWSSIPLCPSFPANWMAQLDAQYANETSLQVAASSSISSHPAPRTWRCSPTASGPMTMPCSFLQPPRVRSRTPSSSPGG